MTVSILQHSVDGGDEFQLQVYSSIESVPEAFDDIFLQTQNAHFYLTRRWFELFEKYLLKPSQQIKIFAVSTIAGKPVLLWFFYQENQCLHSLSNYYTPTFSPVYDSASSRYVVESLVLKEIKRQAISSVTIRPMLKESEHFKQTLSVLIEHGFLTEAFFCFGNWYQSNLQGGFASFYEKLPSRIKNTFTRKWRSISKKEEFRYAVLTDSEEIASHYQHYVQVYSTSWQPDEGCPEFLKAVALYLSENESLRLGIIWLADKPIASQLWVVEKNTAYIVKLAYDPAFKNLSAGTILSMKMFEYVLDSDGVTEIDYLSGDDAYKKDWVTMRREMWGVVAYNGSTFRGWILGEQMRLKKVLKTILLRLKIKKVKDEVY